MSRDAGVGAANSSTSASEGRGGAHPNAVAQRRAALANANERRFATADLKRDLAEGRVTLRDALENPAAERVTAMKILMSVPHIGLWRSRVMLRENLIGESRLVGELTDRQKLKLCGHRFLRGTGA